MQPEFKNGAAANMICKSENITTEKAVNCILFHYLIRDRCKS